LEVEYEGKYYHGIWVPYNENHYVHYIFDITKQKEAEKTIIESNNRYAELFAATPAGVVVYEAINDGENFVFKDFNPTAEKIEKKIKQAVVGQKVTEVFPGVKEFGVFEVFQRVWRSGKSEYFPMSFYKDERDTGSWRENWVYKISDREIVAVYRDVTERKKAEENFVHSEKKFRTLFESIVQGAFWQAADGTLLDVNDSALKIFGISREEFLNRNPLSPKWTVIKEDGTELPGEQHPSMIALRTGKAVRNFTAGVFNPKRNSYVWINVNAIPQFKNVQEMPHEVLVTLHELTEHNKNQALASSRTYSEFDSNIIDSIADPILVINPANYVILAANDAASSEYEIPKEELVGKTCYHATHHLTSPCSASHVCPTKTALETGETTKAEHVHFDKDNNPIIVEIAVHPKKEINGKITEIIHIARNITERKKIEEELRESENRFKKIASQTQGMLYQFKKRPDGTFCVPYTSEAIRSIFGCSPQDVREDFSPIAKAIFNEDLEKVVSSIEDSARKLTPWKCEYRVQVPNHQVKHLWGQSIPEKLSDGSIIWHGYNLDITDRKAMDIAFLENQEKFSALFNSNPDPAVFYNVEFHVVEANPNFCKYFGYSLLELKDRDIAELIVPEEGREESKQVRQKALSGPIEVVGTRMRKDGSLVSVLMAGGPVRLGEKVVGAMFVYKDISDIITVQEALNLALSKAELLNEKLKVVGSLTRHDVRNKLSAVTGYSYLIKKQHSDLADVVNALGRMEQAVKEAMKIFDFAKTYEQIGVENLVDIDVQKAVQEATNMFSDLPFNVASECDGLIVKADSLLRQLIYNLIDNTRKYGKKTTLVKVYYSKTASGQLQLVYEDDGVGIPNESKGQLFKKGFSTGGSSGFGLFLSKKIIDVYGWNIEEIGEPDKGAKFIITIN